MEEMKCEKCEKVYVNPEDYIQGTCNFRVCSQGNLWFECSCNSGMMLPKGQFEWYSPTQRMGEKATTLFNDLQEVNSIPLIPSDVAQILKMVTDETLASKDLEIAIKSNPPLMYNIVDLANNLIRTSNETISSLAHAISYLGRKQLKEVITSSIVKTFRFETKLFKHEEFWQKSTVAGLIAEMIIEEKAPELKEDKDKAFLAASMANVGKVVYAICFPEKADEIFAIMDDPTKWSYWQDAETRVEGYDHCILGEIGAALWGFPEYVLRIIRYHHTKAPNVREFRDNTVLLFDFDETPTQKESKVTLHDVVVLANQYAHWVLLEPHAIDIELFQSYLDKFKIDEKEKDRLGNQFTEAIKENLGTLFTKFAENKVSQKTEKKKSA